MNNDKKLTSEEAARKLQGMVSLGIPDTNFTVREKSKQTSAEPLPETVKTVEKEVKQAEQEIQASPVPAPARRKRKEQSEGYRETYFRRVDFSDRQPLYITRSTHEKLMMIVGMIGGRKATIGSYVENVLLQHLENHREEINRLLDEQYQKNKNEL